MLPASLNRKKQRVESTSNIMNDLLHPVTVLEINNSEREWSNTTALSMGLTVIINHSPWTNTVDL